MKLIRLATKDFDNLFPSGHWLGSYFQYKRWDGPHTFSLSFDHHELKVTGWGTDDVGTFSIDGTYSSDTRQMDLTKKYQEDTGNPLENLGHTVTIQLEWNIKKRQFNGTWYVKTKKYCGKDKFELLYLYILLFLELFMNQTNSIFFHVK
jgi:hypothetical protein